MAGETNYIGVAMGLDVTDLKAGLSEANKQIQLANSEFKAASSGMDDWTKSTEGLSAKVKQLDTVLKMQQAKLAGLTAEYEKVVKEQGEGSEAARKLKVQINNQQAVVNRTQSELKNYTETLRAAEDGTIDLETATIRGGKVIKQYGDNAQATGGKLDGLKSVAGGVVAGIAAIGAAAIAAVGAFLSLAESTRETRENFNKLETGFTTAGHSAKDAEKTYRELYGILGDEGQATEAAAHLAKLTKNQEELSQWTNIAAGVYATFGDSLPIENLTEAANETAKTGKITGGLADALNWAGKSEEEFQAQLDAASSEQERQALITSTLNGLYSDQADKFKELNGDIIAAKEADAALAQAMAELGAIAEPIMTTLKLLAVELLGEMKPFVELIGSGLLGAMKGTAGATTELAEGIGGILTALVERFTTFIPTLLGLVLQLVPQLASGLIGALPTLLETILSLSVQITNMIATLLPQIVQKIVQIIPILITSLVAAIPQLLNAAVNLLMAIVNAIPTIITSLLAALPTVINTIINAVLMAFPMLIDAAIRLFMALVQALPTIIQALVQALPKVINAVINGLLGALPLLLAAAIELFMAIVDALPTIIRTLVVEVPKIVNTIVNTLLKNLPALIDGAIQLFFGILEAIPMIQKELIKSIPDIIGSIVDGLIEGIPDLIEAGGDLLAGLFEGFLNPKAIWEAVKSLGSSIVDAAKSFFGIKSPSKLMREEVGQYLGEGVGVGFLDSIPTVKKQLGKFAGFVEENLGGIKTGLSVNAGGGGALAHTTSGNTVVNAGMTVNYNGALSRKQLKQLENDRNVSIEMYLRGKGAI